MSNVRNVLLCTSTGCNSVANDQCAISTAAIIPTTCASSSLTASPATAPIACYKGLEFYNSSSLYYGGSVLPVPVKVVTDNLYCLAVTGECASNAYPCRVETSTGSAYLPAGTTVRFFFGVPSLLALSSSASLFSNVRDVTVCTTDNCNSPFADTCALSAAGYTSLMCGGGTPVVPTAATTDIVCYANTQAAGALQTTAIAGNPYCVAATIVCQGGLSATFCAAQNASVGTAIRVYSDIKSLAAALANSVPSSVTLTKDGLTSLVFGFLYPLVGDYSPGNPTRKMLSDIVICGTAGCNAPSSDSCALASAPAVASVAFSALPAAAFNADGTVTSDAVNVLTAALKTAVNSNGCATCSVTITKIVDASGKVLFGRSRRLAGSSSGITVTFATTGGSAAALAAVTSAATGSAFIATLTSAVQATPGGLYAGVSASAAPTSAAAPPSLVLLALLTLLVLVVVPVVYFKCFKNQNRQAAPALAIKTVEGAGGTAV